MEQLREELVQMVCRNSGSVRFGERVLELLLSSHSVQFVACEPTEFKIIGRESSNREVGSLTIRAVPTFRLTHGAATLVMAAKT